MEEIEKEMIQNRNEIIDLCRYKHLIKPFNIEMVQSASIDIRIGVNALVRYSDRWENDKWEKVSFAQSTETDPFFVYPSSLWLMESLENIYLPNDIAAQFMLKSSVARCFFQHMLAGWCDPGWCGKLTMEFKNLNYEPYPVWVGKPIGQLIFHKINPVEESYNGRYQGIFEVSENL